MEKLALIHWGADCYSAGSRQVVTALGELVAISAGGVKKKKIILVGHTCVDKWRL